MTYTEFKERVRTTLGRHPQGLIWSELREKAKLPSERACPEWTKQLEAEIGLSRREKKGRSLIWRLDNV